MKVYFIQELKRVLSRRYTFYILMAMLIFLLLHIPYNHAQAKKMCIRDRRLVEQCPAQKEIGCGSKCGCCPQPGDDF